MSKTEADKRELSFDLDSFNSPAEYTSVKAWTKLITNLIFMRKGQSLTDPEMGCGIQDYEYAFVDEVRDEIQSLITEQTRKYLPDIPLNEVTVLKKEMTTGEYAMLILLKFTLPNNTEANTVVATSKDALTKTIDFEVVF